MFLNNWLDAESTSLWAEICCWSSLTRVTSKKSSSLLSRLNVLVTFVWKSFHFRQNFSIAASCKWCISITVQLGNGYQYLQLKYGTIKCYKYLNENIRTFRTVYQSLSTLLKLETQVQGDRTFGREKLGYLWQSYLCLKFAMANEDIE